MHYTNAISDTIYDNVQRKKITDEKKVEEYKKRLLEEGAMIERNIPSNRSIFDTNNSDFILLTKNPKVMIAYDNMRYGRGSEVVC